MNLSSPWISLAPLLFFNIALLATVLHFRRIYEKRGRTDEVETRHASQFLNRWMREYWLWLTEPCVRVFVALKITPNQLTFIGLGISILSAYFFAHGHFGLAGWMMILAGTFDIFDGRVARATHNETRSGAYLDAVIDRVSEGLVFLGLAIHFCYSAWFTFAVVMAFMGAFMVSYTRAKGEAFGATYTAGAMQRPERFVYIGVGAIFAPIFGWALSFMDVRITDYLFAIPLLFVMVMSWMTTVDRIWHVMKIIEKNEKKHK